MPTIASILEPKLTAVTTRITEIQTKLQESGAYPNLTKELQAVAQEAAFISEFAGRLVVELRMSSE